MVNWNKIDTILLDMDGTLLDLYFDNYFWREHVPTLCGIAFHKCGRCKTHVVADLSQQRGHD